KIYLLRSSQMPLPDKDLRDVQNRIYHMFMDTIETITEIEKYADIMYGQNAEQIRLAINEYLDDFIRATNKSGEPHPEALIYKTSRERFHRAGLYGAQLAVKERHVKQANAHLRESLGRRFNRFV